MSKKTSAAAKAARDAYTVTGRRVTNKLKKIERHCKKHPTDEQSRNRVKPATAGQSHEKRTPLEARLFRATKTGAKA